MNALRSSSTLCRLPVALFAAASAFTGSVLASPHPSSRSLTVSVAVLLLASGASALNQHQERDLDAKMERTRGRPLPAGTLSPRAALVTTAVLISAGLLLAAVCGTMPLLLGLAALLWYNVLYTPLKRRTAFAAIYGAPVGMFAPAIGWTAGGGSIADPRLFALAMLFFLWQVPHFWLLVLRSGGDYERAGLPSLRRLFSDTQIARITSFWTVAAASAAVLLPLYGIVRSPAGCLALALASILLAAVALRFLRQPAAASFGFTAINAFLAVVMLLASADSLLRSVW